MDFAGKILILDDEEIHRQQLETIISFLGCKWQSGELADCLPVLANKTNDITVGLVGNLGTVNPTQLLTEHAHVPFIFISGVAPQLPNMIGVLGEQGTYESLLQLLRLSYAFYTLTHNEQQSTKVQSLLHLVVGTSTAIQKVRHVVEKVAQTTANVLICGEKGTGKKLVARAIHELGKYRAIHELGKYRGMPFVQIQCGAITNFPDLRTLDQENTILLTDIDALSITMQEQLLLILQAHIGKKLIRVIATTHCNLKEMVQKGTFCQKLYDFCSVVTITIPPLRARTDDIPMLLQEFCQQHQVGVSFTQDAITTLKNYNWPRNVRELANLVEQLISDTPNAIVDVRDLPEQIQCSTSSKEALLGMLEPNEFRAQHDNVMMQPFNSVLPVKGINLKELVTQVEKDMIKQALEVTDGVIAKAAIVLQMRRTTLVEKIKKYGINSHK